MISFFFKINNLIEDEQLLNNLINNNNLIKFFFYLSKVIQNIKEEQEDVKAYDNFYLKYNNDFFYLKYLEVEEKLTFNQKNQDQKNLFK